MNFIEKLILLAIMIFCHIVDDYYLQGILSNMKVHEWWHYNAPANCYRNDYIMALFEHAFSWSFVMSVPLLVMAIYSRNESIMCLLIISYIVNTIIHAYTDNLKANKHNINLIQDQSIHILQIITLWGASLHLL